MEGILDLLNSDLGKQIVSGVAGSTGTDTNKTSSVLTMALPVLMKGMERNILSKLSTYCSGVLLETSNIRTMPPATIM